MPAMRQVAIVRHGPPDRALRVIESPTPGPGPGQLLIRVEAIGVNFADALARRGTYPGSPRLPFVPGFEVGGEVAAAGRNVRDFVPGDPVLAFLPERGGYSDHVVTNASQVIRRPAGMSAETGAALPVQGLTAWYALFETGTVRPGDRVLIQAAAGGVGSLAVQLALSRGAEVFGTAGSDAKLAALRENGVHHPINYTTQDYAEEVRRLTHGEGIDIVLDSLGGTHIGREMRLLRAGGRVVCYGYAGQTGSVLRMYLGFALMKTLRTAFLLRDSVGFHGVNLMMLARHPDRVKFRIASLLHAWEEGAVRPAITAKFPLAEAARAHAAIDSRRTTGKLLLIP